MVSIYKSCRFVPKFTNLGFHNTHLIGEVTAISLLQLRGKKHFPVLCVWDKSGLRQLLQMVWRMTKSSDNMSEPLLVDTFNLRGTASTFSRILNSNMTGEQPLGKQCKNHQTCRSRQLLGELQSKIAWHAWAENLFKKKCIQLLNINKIILTWAQFKFTTEMLGVT